MMVIEGLSFRYPGSNFELRVDALQIEAGQRVAVIGPSGCGKTTLLNLLAGVDVPAAGHIDIGDTRISELADAQRRAFRLRHIGMVFQNFELLEYLSVLDNVLLPLRISADWQVTQELRERARELAGFVGIGDKLARHPPQLSQGERQRVAVSRALLLRPQVLLADEPTGNLDPANRTLVLELLMDYASESGATLVTVTHDRSDLDSFDRVIDFDALGGAASA